MREKEIIKKLKAGNEQEVENIIRTNYSFVYSYLYRRCADKELAKELTQETFYKFLKNIHNYNPRDKLTNYLYRIALHLFYDEIRKNKKYSYRDIDINEIEDKSESAKDELNKKNDIKSVQHILSLLPSTHQDILILRFYQELKFKDIAKITGVPISTLKSRYQIALKLVEKYWKEGEE